MSRAYEDRKTKVSKTLSYLLRHGAQEAKLDMRDDGYCRVSDVLQVPTLARLNVTVQEIEETVANCPKQRFSLTTENNQLMIRATQGHSIKTVSNEKLLVPLEDPSQFPDACHGTYMKFWDSILRTGLNRMSRNHIHLASHAPGSAEVISGQRATCDLVIFVDLAAAMRAGIKFFVSENQVILTEGNESGCIPPQFFSRAMQVVRGPGRTKSFQPIPIEIPEPGTPVAEEKQVIAPVQRQAAPRHQQPKPQSMAQGQAAKAVKAGKKQFPYLAVLDFEATCDEDRSFSPHEIIEFPIVVFDTATLEDVATFHMYVKPQHRPVLTRFCTQLTGITQDMVDNGGLWNDVFEGVQKFLAEHGLVHNDPATANFAFVTCGDWDLKTMLPAQCSLFGQDIPPCFHQWINIKFQFESCYKSRARGMTEMLDRLGLPLEGRHHSGIDDVKNIMRVAKQMIRDGHVFELTSRQRRGGPRN